MYPGDMTAILCAVFRAICVLLRSFLCSSCAAKTEVEFQLTEAGFLEELNRSVNPYLQGELDYKEYVHGTRTSVDYLPSNPHAYFGYGQQ